MVSGNIMLILLIQYYRYLKKKTVLKKIEQNNYNKK